MRQIHIIGGGTVAHIRPHLALAAPAYGKVVRDLASILYQSDFDGLVHTWTTKMAGNKHTVWTARTGLDDDEPRNMETNADVAALLDELVAAPEPRIIFLPAALCDFDASYILEPVDRIGETNEGGKPNCGVGKHLPRLRSDDAPYALRLVQAEKVIQRVRKTRKDIFLVGFKTTTGAEPQAQFEAGLTLVKKASCNLVLANDLTTGLNMVVTPEQAPHHVSKDRRHTLRQLVGMTLERSKGHFTRSTVEKGEFVEWTDQGVPSSIPESLFTVVNHCIKRGAYKPFMGKTVGHFAFKVPTGPGLPPMFITSRRGVNFNDLDKVGMVHVVAHGDGQVIATGGKPSVGGQSQRIIFANHPELDCIVHMHVPMRKHPGQTPMMAKFDLTPERIEVRSQEPYECGSHECGQNTSDGLTMHLVDAKGTPLLKAVMLDKHGPNIVFNSRVDPAKVIDFIERHWDLERSTSEVEVHL